MEQDKFNNEIRVWVEQEASIHLKAIDGADPVELTPSEARRLAATLLRMADSIEGDPKEALEGP